MAKKSSPRKRRRADAPSASTPQAGPPISREAKDILLKLVARGLGGGFLASLGINLPPIVEALPAELPVLEVRAEQLDTLFRLEGVDLLHLEFQMTTNTLPAERTRRKYTRLCFMDRGS
jgi:hypothetical protein